MSTLSISAFIISIIEIVLLLLAFRLYEWRRWVGIFFALIPMTLAYLDGRYLWGHHNLLGLLP